MILGVGVIVGNDVETDARGTATIVGDGVRVGEGSISSMTDIANRDRPGDMARYMASPLETPVYSVGTISQLPENLSSVMRSTSVTPLSSSQDSLTPNSTTTDMTSNIASCGCVTSRY